jgi:hypothetical protein
MPSTPQVVATVILFDYLLNDAGAPIPNARITVLLNSSKPTTTISPPTSVALTQLVTTTDANGYWQFSLIPNANLNPANTTWTVQTPDSSYDVTLGSVGPYQSTALGTIVNAVVPLAAATSSVTGPLTVAGLLTALAGLAVTGNEAISGNLSVGGTFTPSAITVAAGEPGIDTSAAGALLLGDNNATSIELGAATTVSVGGLSITGGLVVVTGGAVVTGILTVSGAPSALLLTGAGTANVQGGTTGINLNDNAGANTNLGITNAGAVSVRASLTVGTSLSISGAPSLLQLASAGTAQIQGGTTGLGIYNNGLSAANILTTDAGLITVRNAVTVPPVANGAIPTTTYGTLAVLLDSQTGSAVASLTLTIPTPYRSILVEIECRSDQAANQAMFLQFNADAGANYDYISMQDANTTITGLAPGVAGTSARVGFAIPTGATAGAESMISMRIKNADSTTLRKGYTYDAGGWLTDAAASAIFESGQGQWRNTSAAIASIKFTPNAGNFAFIRARAYGLP